MNKNSKILDFLHYIYRKILPDCLIFVLTIVVIVALFRVNFGVNSILSIIDSYSRLILSSWPGSILLLGILILFWHHNAIDHFIKNRMTGIGPDGVKAAITTTSASDAEVRSKTIKETIETEKGEKNIINEPQKIASNKSATDNTSKDNSTPLNKRNAERYKTISHIENIIQTGLIEKYGDRYKSQVKLSMEGKKDIILDGILYSKNGTAQGIEIKYISSKNYDALRFIITKLKMRLVPFGISRLIVIVAGHELSQQDAIKIQDTNSNLAKMFFYNYDNNDNLVEILIPSRLEKLF
jgi:hypothetical protein